MKSFDEMMGDDPMWSEMKSAAAKGEFTMTAWPRPVIDSTTGSRNDAHDHISHGARFGANVVGLPGGNHAQAVASDRHEQNQRLPKRPTHDRCSPDVGRSTTYNSPLTLGDQCAQNEVIFRITLAPLNDHTIDSPDELERYSTAQVRMSFGNHSDDLQVLAIFRFRHVLMSPQVQFFVGNQRVRDTVVDTPTETTALLLDVPPRPSSGNTSTITMDAWVAGVSGPFVAFTGFEAFLL